MSESSSITSPYRTPFSSGSEMRSAQPGTNVNESGALDRASLRVIQIIKLVAWFRASEQGIQFVRERLSGHDIPFTERQDTAGSVLAISGSSIELRFNALGEWMGTGVPGSFLQTALVTGRELIETEEVQRPIGSICAGCGVTFSSYEVHDFGRCLIERQRMER